MLKIPQSLPDTCLVGGEGRAFATAVAASGAIWFCADPDDVLVDGDAIIGWRARLGGVEMRPSAANMGHARFNLRPGGFVLRAGVHCGLTLAGAVEKLGAFTAAVIFSAPDDDIRTLISLNTGPANDMIFLSESEGQIFAKDRSGSVSVALPSPMQRDGRWRLAIVSYTGHSLHLWADGAMAVAQGVAHGMTSAVDLFVGCRSNRAGLAKTLGAGLIRDVIFWPDRALLAEAASGEIAALQRYARWAAS